jgi:hypothetical protein
MPRFDQINIKRNSLFPDELPDLAVLEKVNRHENAIWERNNSKKGIREDLFGGFSSVKNTARDTTKPAVAC